MGWPLIIVAGILFWAGPQIALAGGDPGFVGVFLYIGWVLLLLALLRWMLPSWHPLLRMVIALLVPVAIGAIIVGGCLRVVRGLRT